jgi:protein-tyrosine-phosphatase
MFTLARAIKAVEHYEASQGRPWDAATRDYMQEQALRMWYERAKEFTRPEMTQMDYLAELTQAAVRATVPIGQNAFEVALKAARETPMDQVALDFNEDPKYSLLVSLCRELQRIAGPSPFFASTDQIQLHFKIGRNQAWLMFRYLIRKKVLELVSSGGQDRANRYRYRPWFAGKERLEDNTHDAELNNPDHQIN